MFEPGSETHWTYLFGLDVAAPGGGELEVDGAFLEDFLLRHYRGLCGSVGSSRGLELDLSGVRAEVEGGGAAFTAAVELFDAFGEGAGRSSWHSRSSSIRSPGGRGSSWPSSLRPAPAKACALSSRRSARPGARRDRCPCS